jgi:hypothetical protein
MSAYDTVILSDSPVGYWPLSETSGTVADDLSTGANNGAYLNSPTLGQTPIALELGDSIVFSGVSSMQTPVSSGYGFTTGSYSVEAWIYPTALSGFQEFISTQGYVRFLLTNANLQSYIDGTLAVSSPTNLSTDTSYHVVLTVDNVALTTNVYINGALDTARNNSPSTINPDQTPVGLIVGSLDGFGTHQYSGNISNVALYAVALTPTQVLNHYNAGTTPPATIPVPDVVGELLAQAEIDIIAATLTVGTITEAFNPAPISTVLTQNPTAGTIVGAGQAVAMEVSQGIVIPDVFNTSIPVATAILAASDFILGAVALEPSGVIISGNVISQTPAAGTGANAGTAVNVVISSGLPALTVPDLFGLTQTDAIVLLLSLGLVPGAIGSAPS